MARRPGVWRRSGADGRYFSTIRGKQIDLGTTNRSEAKQRLAAILAAARPISPGGLSIDGLAALFLEYTLRNRAAATYSEHRRYVVPFAAFADGSRLATSAIPHDLTLWLDSIEPTPAVRRAATKCVKRLFSWGTAEGLLAVDPMARVKLGPQTRSPACLTASQASRLLAMAPLQLKPIVELGLETGMRPQELRTVEARHVVGDRLVFAASEHKTGDKTRSPRVVYLTARALEIVSAAAKEYPNGPILRNVNGEPWTANALRCAFRWQRVRGAAPPGVSARTLRHTYVTEALRKGVSPEAVRQLVGHADLSMLAVYSHMDAKVDHLRGEAARAVGKG